MLPKLFESTRSYQHLSNDYLNLLNQEETFDVLLNVGDENNFETFKAHSIILKTRSEYFKAALSNSWGEDGFYNIDLRELNIQCKLFENILYYIYGGMIINLDNLNTKEKLQLLKTADILMMDSFVDYLEQNLIKEEKTWCKDQPSEVLFVTLQIKKCKNLLKLCNNAILRNPKKFFSSKEFLFIPRNYLFEILDRDILGLEEIDVFIGVIMWGMNNTPNISHFDDFRLWSSEDITSLKSTIIQFLNKVRFFHMQPEDFINKVGPLIKNFSPELYEQVIQYHSKKSTSNYYDILPLRLNSLIIKEKEEAALISYWIKNSYDRKEREEEDTIHDNDKDENSSSMNLIKTYEKYSMIPFNFHLIFRCSGNELKEDADNNKWRQCCYNQGPTLTVIRTKDVNEDEVVFGGFKSVSWSNNDIIGGGKGFIFGYLWKDDKLLLPWMMPVKNHFHGDKILGDGQLLFINFTNGNKLMAQANVWSLEEIIEELEVFIVLHKDTL